MGRRRRGGYCKLNGKILLKYSPVYEEVDYYNHYLDFLRSEKSEVKVNA
jgi:hypothetical protein